MSIQAVLEEDAFNGLDEPLKALYRQNGDSYYLNLSSDEAAKLTPNLVTEIDKLKKHNEKVLGEKKSVQQQLRELQEQMESKPDPKPDAKRDDAELKRLTQSYEDALKAEKERAEQIKQQVADTLKQAAIAKLRADHNLNETADFVLEKFVRVVPESDDSDGLVARVFENGEPALIAGHYKTPEMLLQEWKEQGKHPGIFNAPSGGGTGGRNDYGGRQSGAKKVTRSQFDSMDADAKMEFSRSGGSIVD